MTFISEDFPASRHPPGCARRVWVTGPPVAAPSPPAAPLIPTINTKRDHILPKAAQRSTASAGVTLFQHLVLSQGDTSHSMTQIFHRNENKRGSWLTGVDLWVWSLQPSKATALPANLVKDVRAAHLLLLLPGFGFFFFVTKTSIITT